MFDPKTIAEKILTVVEEANKVGEASEVAIKAFIGVLWPTTPDVAGAVPTNHALGQLTSRMQDTVVQAANDCKSSSGS
jgi:hypothetical protein